MMSRRSRLALIAAASFLVHLKGLSSPVLDYHYQRQSQTAAIARNYHRDGLPFLSPRVDWEGPGRGRAATEFPLYMWLVGLLWPLGGLGDLWGRVLSCLFSALTGAYLCLFLEKEIEADAAFYAGLLFSLIPLEIYFGRTVQPEALALMATTGALYHWSRSLEEPRPWRHWAAATILAFLAIGHKLPYAYILLPLAYLAWDRLRRRALKDARTWLAALAAPAGVAAWYRYASSGVYVVPATGSGILGMLEYGKLAYFIQFQFLSRFPELAATYGGCVLIVLGARELVLRRGQYLLAVWFAAVALTLILGGGYSFHHEYTSLPFAPVDAALMGVGFSWLKAHAKGWARTAAAVLLLSIPIHAALRIKHWYNESYPFLLRAERVADKISTADALFLCNQRAPSLYLYFLDRRGWSWDLAEAGEGRLDEVEAKIKAGARFFMTEKAGAFKDKEGVYARYFYSRYPVVYDDGEILVFRLGAS